MKSSTIRRSNLSKEKIAVLEALSKFNSSNEDNDMNDSGFNDEQMIDGSPEVYVRQNKEKELDILWKDFRMPKGERSPMVFLGIGFVAGIIATLVVSAFIGMSSGNFNQADSASTVVTVGETVDSTDNTVTAEVVAEETAAETETVAEAKTKKFGLFGSKNKDAEAEVAVAPETKEYEVQEGDTMDRIVRSFYGGYSEENVNTVMKANNMTNPNKLSIGQKLIIPIAPSAE